MSYLIEKRFLCDELSRQTQSDSEPARTITSAEGTSPYEAFRNFLAADEAEVAGDLLEFSRSTVLTVRKRNSLYLLQLYPSASK